TLYVTLEPCTMCCGALIHARVRRLVFATREPKAGAVVSTASTFGNLALNHTVEWEEGVSAEASAALLRQFFYDRRSQRKQDKLLQPTTGP
ncbi:MAG: tRNA-specific adenosine deaminase, partial [Halieaceae bacterium]|nr:tRNA-specific adenosine deaminase [Halieaceae bacterium]